MSKQKRILIVRPDRIGDVVLSTAIPREIKKTFPDSFVAVLVREYTQAIYFNNPNIDEIILLENLSGNRLTDFFAAVKKIRVYKFSHALMLLPNERINYLLFFAGIKTRVGVGRKFYQSITLVKEVSRNKYIPLRHEADYCMDLTRRIGVKTDDIYPEIYLSENEKISIAKKKAELIGDKRFLIGIHSTSGNSAPNLKEEEYYRLLNELSTISNITIAITDNKIPESFNNIDNIYFINKEKSLRDSIKNFAMLDLLISASTGPMHICSALKVRTLSLFCPLTACSPKLWGPLGNQNTTIIPYENYCKTQCPGNPKKCNFEGNSGINGKIISQKINEIINV